MAHGPFIAAAFLITAIGVLGLLAHSWIAMRKAEALADDLKKSR
ncbi:MAG: heme exporter protein CcmD [Sphingorhabdus sp.]|nr:heme exporter protein CcmD [Sphingorhabdus sp.]